MDYLHEVGDEVDLGCNGRPHLFVEWRGSLVVGEPPNERIVAVYWLGGETWDCYYDDQFWNVKDWMY